MCKSVNRGAVSARHQPHQASNICCGAQVLSISVDPSGQWLASGSADGSLKLWEVRTGRCMRTWELGSPVHCVAWCPNADLRILAAAFDKKVVLLPSGAGQWWAGLAVLGH